MRKRIIYIISAVILLIVIITVGGSFYMMDFALSSDRNAGKVEGYKEVRKDNPDIIYWLDSLQKVKALRDTTIFAQDGDHHHAIFAYSHTPSNKVAIIIHGYKKDAAFMLNYAKIYADRGYNILLPDLHASGLSEGDVIQMGWKDRKDVMEWMTIANKLFADSTGTTQMVLHGVSMGAATVMCISGEKTPGYVKCFVEDCGYTSAWDEFAGELKNQFGLPAFPLLYSCSELCNIRYGWNFKEASSLRQVKKCKLPMMFIHGDKDKFVPFAMLKPLVEAKKGAKDVYIAHGSEHAASYRDHKKEYIKRVTRFVDRYIH